MIYPWGQRKLPGGTTFILKHPIRQYGKEMGNGSVFQAEWAREQQVQDLEVRESIACEGNMRGM